MPFKKGHKLSKGRPKGSTNISTGKKKEYLLSLLFDEEQMFNDFQKLNVNERMELRIKLAPYILPKPTVNESEINFIKTEYDNSSNRLNHFRNKAI